MQFGATGWPRPRLTTVTLSNFQNLVPATEAL